VSEEYRELVRVGPRDNSQVCISKAVARLTMSFLSRNCVISDRQFEVRIVKRPTYFDWDEYDVTLNLPCEAVGRWPFYSIESSNPVFDDLIIGPGSIIPHEIIATLLALAPPEDAKQ
jgi:hypothetical protein